MGRAATANASSGFRAFLRWEWEREDIVQRAVRTVDTATDPDYQGRGIFTKLTMHALDEMRADDVDFVFNTPNDQSRPGYLKMGWQVAGRAGTSMRLLRPRSVVKLPGARLPASHWSEPSSCGVDGAATARRRRRDR